MTAPKDWCIFAAYPFIQQGDIVTVNPSKPDHIDRLEPQKRQGLVVVLTGNGKGKTSSALGMAVRAVGHGMRIRIVQFMKGDLYAGEWDGIPKIEGDIEIVQTGKGFCGIQGNPYPMEEHRANAQEAITLIHEIMEHERVDLLILDEINNALHLKLIDLAQVTAILDARPATMHLVLTGRDAHPEIIEQADTVSEVREIKHAFRKDIEPQPGIDY